MIENGVLYLTLKKKWFDMILSGEKTEEYREIKEYWLWRLFWKDCEVEGADEIINDMQNPYHRHNNPFELLETFDLKKKEYDYVHFYNGGYVSNKFPNFKIELKDIYIGRGKKEWGAEEDKYYFILKLGKIFKGELE